VTICNFKLWPNKLKSGGYKVPMLSRWQMQYPHGKKVGLPQVQYAFLELPKYEGGDDPRTMVDKWAYFFREAKNLNVVPPALSERPFRDALDVARTATFTPEEWEAYERAKMAEQDARGALAVAHEEGHKSGLTEGLRQAICDLCEVLAIDLSAERKAAIQAMTDTDLTTLRERLKRERRWS
jgi:hypothetical protein